GSGGSGLGIPPDALPCYAGTVLSVASPSRTERSSRAAEFRMGGVADVRPPRAAGGLRSPRSAALLTGGIRTAQRALRRRGSGRPPVLSRGTAAASVQGVEDPGPRPGRGDA